MTLLNIAMDPNSVFANNKVWYSLGSNQSVMCYVDIFYTNSSYKILCFSSCAVKGRVIP